MVNNRVCLFPLFADIICLSLYCHFLVSKGSSIIEMSPTCQIYFVVDAVILKHKEYLFHDAEGVRQV